MKLSAVAFSLALLTTGTQALTPAEFTQSIIDDMQKPNDGVQIGYQRHHYAGTHMGLMARGDYTPSYWKPANKSLKEEFHEDHPIVIALTQAIVKKDVGRRALFELAATF